MRNQPINIRVTDVSRTDITEYSENELSMLVYNGEGLYRMRRQRDFTEQLREIYIFTDEQLEVLTQDLKDEDADNE